VTAERLAVWLYGTHVATIEERDRRLRLTYTDEALSRFAPGSPLLSLPLPLTDRPFTQGTVKPFLDGLLPEEDARRATAERLNLKAQDTFGLIRELGRDCAGAIVIQPESEDPPAPPTTLAAEPLSDEELEQRIRNLRTAPLGINERVRLSLAGAQEKLVLTRLPSGQWGSPVNGAPSTHILKPEVPAYPKTVENEAFCMRLAKHLGLDVAEVDTMTVGDQSLIVVKRYDRIVATDGSVERLHQEDFCQALSIPPNKKYEEDGGPSLRKMAEVLDEVAEPGAVHTLLRATVLNVAIGNGDAHGKNFSLLHDPSGALRLAPLYDLVSTLAYGISGLDRLAMFIDDVQRIDRVTADRLANEAVRWGMSRDLAQTVIAQTLEGIPAAAQAALDETQGVPTTVTGVVGSQVNLLTGGQPPKRNPSSRRRVPTNAAIRS
jgi:serine/threonine-protein kinase HipA